ncbi:unnamed protein product [Peronospora belbahrii]|uniref:Uncharacterized protein n=1 Tax=Peronospora belbahrii TaxID=622444 RepID=A0AAU9KQ14_9STRA|nr:unnamed protein product [Peronospora belbahrii]
MLATVSVTFDFGKLSDIVSLDTMMEYHYDRSSDVIANVGYYITMVPETMGKKLSFVLMVWIDVLGNVLPPSNGSYTDVTVANVNYKLFHGHNNDGNVVFTYVRKEVTNKFSVDLMHFFNYLSKYKLISMSDRLAHFRAGTTVTERAWGNFSSSNFALHPKIAAHL